VPVTYLLQIYTSSHTKSCSIVKLLNVVYWEFQLRGMSAYAEKLSCLANVVIQLISRARQVIFSGWSK
jgi:hypothetical protein